MKFYTPLLQGVRLLQGGTDIFWLLFWLKHLISILYGHTHTHNTAVINLCSTRRFYIKKFYQQQGGTFIRDWVRFYVFIHWSEAGTFIRDGYALFSQKFGQGYSAVPNTSNVTFILFSVKIPSLRAYQEHDVYFFYWKKSAMTFIRTMTIIVFFQL